MRWSTASWRRPSAPSWPRVSPASAISRAPMPCSARLKATIGEAADAPVPIVLPPRRRLAWGVMAAAACLIVAIGFGIIAARNVLPMAGAESETAEGPTAITLASLPAGTNIPRLDTAGLKLVGLAIDPGSVPLISASYRGPHGCRLDLQGLADRCDNASRQRHQPADLDGRAASLTSLWRMACRNGASPSSPKPPNSRPSAAPITSASTAACAKPTKARRPAWAERGINPAPPPFLLHCDFVTRVTRSRTPPRAAGTGGNACRS